MSAKERQQKHRAALKQRGGNTITHDLSPEAVKAIDKKGGNRTQKINLAIVNYWSDK